MSEEIKEINRIIQSIRDFYKMDNALKYYLDRQKAKILLNYITNLQQKVEQLENIRKEAIEYINHTTIGADSSPIEDSWLYNLYETRNILNKGE